MRPLLALPAVAVLVLAGCAGGGSNDPQNDAFNFCEQQVTATFEDPQSAEFGQWSGGGIADEQRYEFEAPVDADGQTFDLTCVVTGEPGSFVLETYELIPAAG